ncbi:MAG: DUF1735 domain-containing protein, partial [Bacteroidota bacterium]|nr:DUF1735 domain-containing protein [Bacteroidota bacterium]
MNSLSKITVACASIVLLASVISSCNKPDVITYSKEGSIYMPRAANGNSSLLLLLADTAQTTTFGASYGGLRYPSQDINVTFQVDPSLITNYNATHGTSYVLLPAPSYSIPSLMATIKAGETGSNNLPLNIITTNLDKAIKYILPVTLASTSSGFIDSSLRTTYFTVDTIRRLEKDITSMATLS